jgi:type IV secretion system protein VirB9
VPEKEIKERQIREEDGNTNIIHVREPVFIPQTDEKKPPLTAEQVVRQSLNEALVTPNNFIGGTQFYDYDEHKQFPVVCKVLSLSVIQLEDGEVPIGMPSLSDTLRWEITGDVWRTQDGKNVQLIMLKPMEVGLKTNMIIVTNRRIYQILLSSTRDSYMPMIKFRYPFGSQFITARTMTDTEKQNSELKDEEGLYLSYNYRIIAGWAIIGLFKPEWTPLDAWDDGHKTYIRLPRMVLQKEYPTIFEKRNYIVNYRLDDDLIIIDKLITEITLRLDNKRVRVIKKRGKAENLMRYIKTPIEVVETPVEGEKPMTYTFEIKGEAVWMPKKVLQSGEETILLFDGEHFLEDGLHIIDEENKPVEYVMNGNIITIQKVISKISLAYNLETVEIIRK